jgi:diketogulonate reductase-like aldo/keto reductase
MAYSPLGQAGKLLRSSALKEVAEKYRVSPAQAALAWCLREPVLAIPKAGSVSHVEENAGAEVLMLEREDQMVLNLEFPRPHKKQPLAML